jgi:hypothetical protein
MSSAIGALSYRRCSRGSRTQETSSNGVIEERPPPSSGLHERCGCQRQSRSERDAVLDVLRNFYGPFPPGRVCQCRRVRTDRGPDWKSRRGATWIYSAGFGGTPGPFASGGVILGTVPAKCNRCAFGAVSSGALIQASMGPRSGRASLGYESRNPIVGFGAQLTFDRAWSRKGSVPAGASYLGPEVIAAVAPVVMTTGVLWRVSGESAPRARWSWQLAVGF